MFLFSAESEILKLGKPILEMWTKSRRKLETISP